MVPHHDQQASAQDGRVSSNVEMLCGSMGRDASSGSGSFDFAQDFACGARRPQNGQLRLRAPEWSRGKPLRGAPLRIWADLNVFVLKLAHLLIVWVPRYLSLPA